MFKQTRKQSVAVIGAGVSGLSCAVLFAERGYCTSIFADELGQRTTSAAAAAIWFPYDAEPADAVIGWSLATFAGLQEIARHARSGVSMTELRCFARAGEIAVPGWAKPLGARRLHASELLASFTSGYMIDVPLADTTIYLDYLAKRLSGAGVRIRDAVRFAKLEEVPGEYDLIVNCTGIGARALVSDTDLEPHRGQVLIIEKMPLPFSVVCDDPPLMYAIPRANDCVLGGTNDVSDDRTPRSSDTAFIMEECAPVLPLPAPKILGERVGLRPFRRTGVRLARERLRDGRTVIHNYGHGGSGFTLSWGCAEAVFDLAIKSNTLG